MHNEAQTKLTSTRDASTSSHASTSATRPASVRALLHATAQVEPTTWLALLCVLTGWFFVDTLKVNSGPLQQGVPFYAITSVIGNPIRLLTGVEGSGRTGTFLFSLLCLVALLGPLAPFVWKDRVTWLAYLTPLLLMAVCAAALYERTSGDFLAQTADASGLESDVIRFANEMLHRAGDVAARRVTFAAGGYLSLIGSAYLAWRGIRGFHLNAR